MVVAVVDNVLKSVTYLSWNEWIKLSPEEDSTKGILVRLIVCVWNLWQVSAPAQGAQIVRNTVAMQFVTTATINVAVAFVAFFTCDDLGENISDEIPKFSLS